MMLELRDKVISCTVFDVAHGSVDFDLFENENKVLADPG